MYFIQCRIQTLRWGGGGGAGRAVIQTLRQEGGSGRQKKKIFSALRALVWYKNKGGKPSGPLLWILLLLVQGPMN